MRDGSYGSDHMPTQSELSHHCHPQLNSWGKVVMK